LEALAEALQRLGRQLCAWRDDTAARRIHEPKQFKTEVDRRSHEILVAALGVLSPGVPVVSEEDDPAVLATLQRPQTYWLIDPLDGTASWYGGFDGFVTQVALIDSGIPVAGAIHAPVLGKTWLARRGRGATLNGALLRRRVPGDPLVFVDNTPVPHGITLAIMQTMGSQAYRESGSLGLKAAMVADGSADVFVKDVVVRDWDMAPAFAVLHEVGGALVGHDGRPYRFDGPLAKEGGFVVAATSSISDMVMGAWRRHAMGSGQPGPHA
jgi:3'(2'), 5'-bisphosphate nucleotidase